MSLNNMKTELTRHGIIQSEIAEFLGMTASNFNRKLAETVPFTRDEMFAIRDKYFPEKSIDYLFQSDGNVPSEAESLHAQIDSLREVIEVSDEDMAAMHARLDEII